MRKVGLITIEAGRVLVVRKVASKFYILPGGKIEGDESNVECLKREIREELGTGVAEESLEFLKEVVGPAANEADVLELVLYKGCLTGAPNARAEIEEVRWWLLEGEQEDEGKLSPLLYRILPFIRALE